MKSRKLLLVLFTFSLTGCTTVAPSSDSAKKPDTGKTGAFALWPLPDRSDLSSTGRNPYFILEPGYRLVLKTSDGIDSLTISVLNETRQVDGVQTRVVEERETKHGKLIEVSRNYFAIAKSSKDVFYFGEEVDTYKDGKITGHEGAWLAGVNGARPGLMMPGNPRVGDRFYQEQAHDVAMDRCEIVSTSESATTPAGMFTDCLKTAEGSDLEKGDSESKLYAPGVGLIAEEDFRLVEYTRAAAGK